MAYIDWWNRTGPVTLGERFGLNGIKRVALAKGTPGGWWGDWELNYKDQMTFEEYKKALDIDKNPSGLEKAEGGRIALGDGSITYVGQGEHKGEYHLRLGGKKNRKTHHGTKAELEIILKNWKITNPPGVNVGKQIIKGDPKKLKAILEDIPKMSNTEVIKKHNVSRTTLWEIMQDHPKLKFGKKEFNPYLQGPKLDPNVTERLNKLQNVLKTTEIPVGEIKANSKIVEILAKKMNLSKADFLSAVSQLKVEYGSPTGRIDIIENVKKNIKRFPDPKFIRDLLRAVGYGERTIGTLDAVERASRIVSNTKTNLEHSLPKNLIKFFKLPRKYLLMGERTSDFLNQFKKQFDTQLLNKAKAYVRGDLTYNEYKKEVDAIRNTVRNATGGYEIGYVDFKDGKPVPVTSQKSLLKGTDVTGKKTTGLINFFKNSQYHNALYENWVKDKNNKIFGTLNEEIKKNKLKFLPEKELAETYNAIKNFKNKKQFFEYYKKYPTSPFFKSLSKVASMAGGKGKLILGGAATFSLLSTALSAEEPGDEKAETTLGEYAAGAAGIGTGVAITKYGAWNVAKALGRWGLLYPMAASAVPFWQVTGAGIETVKAALEKRFPDYKLDDWQTWMRGAFWDWGIKTFGLDKMSAAFGGTFKTLSKMDKARVIRNVAARGLLSPKAVKFVSKKIAWPVTAGLAYHDLQKWVKENVRKEPLTIEEQQDIQTRKKTVPKMLDINEQAYKMAKEQGISYEEAFKKIKQELSDKGTPLSNELKGVNLYEQLTK